MMLWSAYALVQVRPKEPRDLPLFWIFKRQSEDLGTSITRLFYVITLDTRVTELNWAFYRGEARRTRVELHLCAYLSLRHYLGF